MIDSIYNTLLTILNKEQQGYISPTEFNLIANNVQNEIFREYFEDGNRDKNKENRGLTNNGYSNLNFNLRQRLQQFASITTLTLNGDKFDLPEDLYFIEEDGVTAGATETYPDTVIDEVERNQIAYLNKSIAKPTALYPVYERYGDNIVVSPSSIDEVKVRYLRKPKAPNWTYSMVSNQPMFNPANASFQDFELHESEYTNIVLKMLSYLGINLREADVVQVAESMKDKMNLKDNS